MDSGGGLMTNARSPLFFHDKPLFGLEIGHGSLKVMQLAEAPKHPPASGYSPRILGYGANTFDKKALQDGTIMQPELIAQAALDMFQHKLVGDITTPRVAIAIPAYRTFTRALHLPKLRQKELDEAVELEAEQYISLPLEDLYLDYEVIKQTDDANELFVVATPRVIVDSYLELAQILGLEAVLIEPSLGSLGRLFSLDDLSDTPAIIINLGSVSSDICIFDQHVLVTGTVQAGGEDFTKAIKDNLQISLPEAAHTKTQFGLSVSKNQSQIRKALEPILQEIVREVRRMIRYYEERYGNSRPITQVITLGGGANMPGLDEYLTEALRMPVRHSDPWQYFNYDGLQPPDTADRPMYSTAAGLSLAKPQELFRND